MKRVNGLLISLIIVVLFASGCSMTGSSLSNLNFTNSSTQSMTNPVVTGAPGTGSIPGPTRRLIPLYNVYIAGFLDLGMDRVACYWKNGVRVDLGSESAYSIYVSNPDVYLCGDYREGTTWGACYWKNGVRQALEQPPGVIGTAQDIFISGADIYCAGNYYSQGNFIACYWKNGIRYDLPGNSWGNSATAIVVNSYDVYIAGKAGNAACYWQNGIRYDLDPNGAASDIFISDSDIYVGGNYYNDGCRACYWRNGVRIDLPVGTPDAEARCSSIFVVNTDVYCGGNQFSDQQACYWKNGVQTLLDGFYTESIFVINSDIYCAGTSNQWEACYWKNNVRYNLPGATGEYDMATDIVVVPAIFPITPIPIPTKIPW